MIYIFEILGTDYIKLGYTKHENVYYRIRKNGFYSNEHPVEICNKLGPENLKLLYVYEGNYKTETYIKHKCPSFCGEFYKKSDLENLKDELDKITVRGHMFDRPNDDFFETENFEKLICCGGEEFICNLCDPPKCFPRLIKYQTHKKEKHGKKMKFDCECKKTFTLKRNLDRHKAQSCKLNCNKGLK